MKCMVVQFRFFFLNKSTPSKKRQRHMIRPSFYAAALLSFSLLPFSAVHAAEVTKTPNAEMKCYLSIRGPIETGDMNKIHEAMAAFYSDHPEDPPQSG
jgi:hypothetical protein